MHKRRIPLKIIYVLHFVFAKKPDVFQVFTNISKYLQKIYKQNSLCLRTQKERHYCVNGIIPNEDDL